MLRAEFGGHNTELRTGFPDRDSRRQEARPFECPPTLSAFPGSERTTTLFILTTSCLVEVHVCSSCQETTRIWNEQARHSTFHGLYNRMPNLTVDTQFLEAPLIGLEQKREAIIHRIAHIAWRNGWSRTGTVSEKKAHDECRHQEAFRRPPSRSLQRPRPVPLPMISSFSGNNRTFALMVPLLKERNSNSDFAPGPFD